MISKSIFPIQKSEKFANWFKREYIFLVLAITLLPFNFYVHPSLGVDASWVLSINMAVQQKLHFGTEYIFTYGPLGFLSTRLPNLIAPWPILLFDFFLLFSAIFFTCVVYRKLTRKKDILAVIAMFGFFNFLDGALTDVILYFYFLFFANLYLKKSKSVYLVVASLLACIAFYVKVNIGLILDVLMFFYIFLCLFRRIGNIFLYPLILVLWILLNIFLINTLHVDFLPYISNSLGMINYYNDAMFIPPYNFQLIEALLIIFFLFGLFARYHKEILQNNNDWFICLNLVLFVFILFKQGFVRADGHIYSFFFSIGYVFLQLILVLDTEIIKKYLLKALPYLIVVALSPIFINAYGYKIYHWTRKPLCFVTKTNYYQKFDSSWDILPQRFIEKIGKSTIDIFPFQISLAYFNHLNYSPRPIVQSYSAYSENFINLNASKYLSDSAPDFILLHQGQIDARHPIWEDSKALLAMLQRYNIVDSAVKKDTFYLLFKKTPAPILKVRKKILLDTIVSLENKITLPKTQHLLYMECEEGYTIAGKIRRFLFQPTLFMVELNNEDGSNNTVRAVLPIVKTPVLVNKSLLYGKKQSLGFEATRNLFQNKGEGGIGVKSILFKGDPVYLLKSFRLRFWEYTLEK